MFLSHRVVSACALCIVSSMPALAQADVDTVDYRSHIEPLFRRHCFECHGPDKQESGIRLDRRATLLQGGDFGEPTVVPGDPDKSFLIQVLRGKIDDLVMPPGGPQLSASEVKLVEMWIEQGAAMPEIAASERPGDHWSFQPIASPPPPQVEGVDVQNPVDAFIAATLRNSQLERSPPADRRTLLRRLYLVAVGLPPSPTEVNDFLRDDASDAYERLVDRVLASPRYGERWARHWLDVVRFGETHGFETNRERPNAWPYRDYVIDAFNADLRFDQFARQQLAGDAHGAHAATGFLVAGPHDIVKSPDVNLTLMQRQDELADLVNVTGTAFLGLTLGCARCHSHKFDPITQRDYYAVQAVFAGVHHGERALPASTETKLELQAVEDRIAELRADLARFVPAATAGIVLIDDEAARDEFRPPVSASHNVERLEPIKAKYLRFTIRATSNAEPCIDELEVWSGSKNVALASLGTTATCSSTLPGYAIHKLEHINDGRYGNGRSWISNEIGSGWVQLEFPSPIQIDRVEWARDREQKFSDRLATDYVIEAAVRPDEWFEIASSRDRLPCNGTRTAEAIPYRFDAYPTEIARQGRAWLKELNAAEKRRKQLEKANMVYAGEFRQPGPTYRLHRGDPTAKREQVSANVPALFTNLELGAETPEQDRRMRFADWLVDHGNPLTARVVVNRIWQHDFGTGIVNTPSDVGANGGIPSHPELLDWLASELIANGWSVKHIQRLILRSNTFRQDSKPNAKGIAVDAGARLLWRFPPRRLEAESIRDSVLVASGLLNNRMRGPGFSAFEVDMENVRHYFPKKSYGADDWRRMIYMTKVRQEQDSVFGVFDCPDASQAIARRSRSTTPLQALSLFNSSFMIEQAAQLARRLESENPDLPKRVAAAFMICFAREPDEAELADSVDFATTHGLQSFCRAMLNSNEFLFVP